MAIKQKIKKWHIIVLVILGIGGYWISQNMWLFEKSIPVEEYESKLVSIKEWKEIKSSPTIFGMIKKGVYSTIHFFDFFSEENHDIPKSYYQDTVTFGENGIFMKQSNFSPSVDGVWDIENNTLIITDDASIDVWGGGNWFNKNIKIVRLTNEYLVLYRDDVYFKYVPIKDS